MRYNIGSAGTQIGTTSEDLYSQNGGDQILLQSPMSAYHGVQYQQQFQTP